MSKEKKEKLESLKRRMSKDSALPLRKGATNLVFGDGSENAYILFVGEGPGYWEDMKGKPFVGNAGAFLNQLLQTAGLERGEVFITNVIHFRPPENRDPTPEEINAFKPYLDEMIKIIDPKVVVTLGRFSMAKFLPNARISSIHGKAKVVNWKGKEVTVVPMYHPAAGLRNGSIRNMTIEDFKNFFQEVEKVKENRSEKQEEKGNTEQMSLV